MRMCPPGTSWYSRDSFQQIASGSHRGTVIAIVPPGRSTRTSSSSAWRSAGTCSRISAATIRSNYPSPNGSDRASPSLTSASAPSGTSPAWAIATNRSRTRDSSSASWSKATTSAPRRYISKACRPAPQPRSRARSPGPRPSLSKSTVSTCAPLAGEVGDRLVVRRGGRGRGCAPAEQLLHPTPAGRAVPLSSLGVVEERGEGRRQRADVTGRDQVGAQPVGSDHLGDRAGPRDDQRCRGGHELGRWEREALVQAGHARDLGRSHQPHQVVLADAVDEPAVVADREVVEEPLGAAARDGLGDQQELEVGALGAQLG